MRKTVIQHDVAALGGQLPRGAGGRPALARQDGPPGQARLMLTISTDPSLVDVALVHRWLSTDAYWALGRPLEVVERSVAHSLNVGAYDDGVQVGYARVVTDQATFAWLCDVYVDPARRGAGIGSGAAGRGARGAGAARAEAGACWRPPTRTRCTPRTASSRCRTRR